MNNRPTTLRRQVQSFNIAVFRWVRYIVEVGAAMTMLAVYGWPAWLAVLLLAILIEGCLSRYFRL